MLKSGTYYVRAYFRYLTLAGLLFALILIVGTTLAATVVATIPVGDYPLAIGINPITNRIYVANSSSGTVSVIDAVTHSVLTTISVGGNTSDIAVNAVTNRI